MPAVTVLLQPAAADWEFAPVLSVLHYFFQFDVRIATPDGEPAQTMGGLRIAADETFAATDLERPDAVVLIGSDAWAQREDASLAAKLRARADHGRSIGAICAGTLPLAQAGLLDERPHTSNALGFLKENAPTYRGEGLYRDVAHAVSDGTLVTAPGSAPASFACAVVAAVHPERAGEVMAYWNMARGEFEALGTDLAPVFRDAG